MGGRVWHVGWGGLNLPPHVAFNPTPPPFFVDFAFWEFAFFKGENEALQMIVSSILIKDTRLKLGTGSSGLHVAYEYALMSDVLWLRWEKRLLCLCTYQVQ